MVSHDTRRKLQSVDLEIRRLTAAKHRMLDTVQGYIARKEAGEMDDHQLYTVIRMYLNGKPLSYWVDYFNGKIREAYWQKNKISEQEAGLQRRRSTLISGFVLLFVIFGLMVFNRPTFTARVVTPTDYVQHTEVINQTFNQTAILNLQLEDNLLLPSAYLKLSLHSFPHYYGIETKSI